MIEKNVKPLRPAPFRKNRFADRGKVAEDATQKFLEGWAATDPRREVNRLVDTKAAGRTIKAAAADFEYFCFDGMDTHHGLIEVKETEHEYRLDKKRLTQHARLRKRAKCGGGIFVLVFHSTTRQWRCMTRSDLGSAEDTKGSWDLRDLPTFSTVQAALTAVDGMWE